jgi:MFS family permease
LLAIRATSMFGFRGTLIGVAVVLFTSFVVLGAWHSVYAFAAIGAITLAFSMMMPVVSDYLNRRIPSSQRATILSLRQLFASVGIAALQPGLGVIADYVSLTAVFWTSALFVGVLVPPALLLWLRADAEEQPPPAVEIEAAAAG